MKKFIYWLMGERSGRVILAIWHWLWGVPVESGGKIAVEVAGESLHSMQQSVFQLTDAIAKLLAAYETAKQKYESKQNEFRSSEKQARLAYRQGNEEAARLAMTKAIMIEQLLPQLAQQVAQAEKVVVNAKEKLNRERQKLETYKLQMQNLKDISEVNEALSAIAQFNCDLNSEEAQSQFETASSAVQKRHLQVNAQLELLQSHDHLQSDLERITLDDEITRRLQQFDTSPNN